jgi:diguanylate cyclase (GGDEF)-like protein/PAS domain S-box-containing protein
MALTPAISGAAPLPTLTVRVGIYNNPPKVFWDDQGQPTGFWVEVLAAIAAAEGWHVDYVACSWHQCLHQLEQGDLDLMMDVAYSEERDRVFDFNQEVVLASWSVVYTRPGMTVESILDLDQKRVAVVTGSIQESYLKQRAEAFGIQPEFIAVPNFDAVFQHLDEGIADAGLVNRFFGNRMAPRYGVQRSPILIYPSRLHFVVADGQNPELLTALDRQMRPLLANGNSAYYQALARWLKPTPGWSWPQLRQAVVTLALALPFIGIGGLLVWNRTLRREVKRRRQAEAQLQTLANNAPGVIYRYGRRGEGDRLHYISSGCTLLWGVDPDALRADVDRFWQPIQREDAARLRHRMQASAQQLSPLQWEGRLTSPAGEERWIQITAQPQRLSPSHVIWDGFLVDISDRKQAEQSRLRTEAENQAILSVLPDFLFRVGADGVYRGFITAIRDFSLVDEHSTLGQPMAAVLPAEVAERQQHALQTALATGEVQIYEQRIWLYDHWQDEEVRVIKCGDDEVVFMVRDISDRKRAEADLKASEQRFQNMAANVPGALFQYVLYPDGGDAVIYMSGGCYDLWEVEAEQVLNDASILWAMVDPADLPPMQASVQASARTLDPWCFQWRITPPSGRVKWLEAAGRPTPQPGGEVIWDTVVIDVSSRKQAEQALETSEVRYRKVVESQTDFILRSRPDTTITFANRALCKALGVTHQEIEGKHWSDFASAEDLHNQTFAALAQLTPDHPRCFVENRDIRADGQLGWTQWLNEGIFNDAGELVEIQSVGRDITALKQTEQALRDSEERLRLVTENMEDLVCLHSPEGRYRYVTPSSITLLGYTPAELIGRDPYDFFHPDDRALIRSESHAKALQGHPVPTTYRMRCKSGEYIWLETITQPICDDQGQILHLQTTSRNVSDRVRIEAQLKHDACHDALTGLPNRHLLLERLEDALQRIRTGGQPTFAVLFCDLDNFKVVNDSLGHLQGDALLVNVAQLLQQFIGPADLAARLGGDEFVMLLNNVTHPEVAAAVANQILTALRSPISLGSREVFVDASIGIALGTGHHQNATDLLRDADLAMYRAKQKGKGQYAIFDPSLHWQVVQRLHLENDLRNALEQGDQLVLHYQPIVTLDTQQIKGFEALVRWQHPTRGLLSPSAFIPIAEETGLVTALGRWVLHTACQQLAQWQQQFPHTRLYLSVNLSVKQLQPSLLAELDRALALLGPKPQGLVLELTESMLVENLEGTSTLLREIRDRGVALSIDDFGTGYSSLSYLHRLPVTALKIDRAFVSPDAQDKRHQVIAKSIISLSNLLHLDAIAEGIEAPSQLLWLQAMGCELGQGYLFSRPIPAAEATHLLQYPAVSCWGQPWG